MADAPEPTRFNAHFQLNHTQAELDFANVAVDADVPLFVDPFAIAQRLDSFSIECSGALYDFFSRILDAIRSGNESQARPLLRNLREPNETRFGYSKGRPRFIQRCRDSFKEDRGLVITLDDEEIFRLLTFAGEGRRVDIDRRLTELFDEVWYS